MDLKTTLIILKRWVWLLILMPLIGSGTAAWVTLYIMEPQYEASATVYITNQREGTELLIAYNDIMASQKLVKDYREIIKSRSVTKEVLDKLSLSEMSSEELAEKIKVELKNETSLMEITVNDNDPKRAEKITGAVVESFIQKINSLIKMQNISIVDKPEAKEEAVSPKTALNIVLGFIAGLISATGAVFMIELLNSSIKDAKDIELYLGYPTLGIIPRYNFKINSL